MYLEEQPFPKMNLFLVSTLQIVRFMKLSFLSVIIETEKINFHKVFYCYFRLDIVIMDEHLFRKKSL